MENIHQVSQRKRFAFGVSTLLEKGKDSSEEVLAFPFVPGWRFRFHVHTRITSRRSVQTLDQANLFLAQGLAPVSSEHLGCWLHGRAGEMAGNEYPAAVPASELPSYLAAAWKELEDPL